MLEALNRCNEHPDPETLNYHKRQWREPYRQTVAFADFISEFVVSGGDYVDAGCGAGSATQYFRKYFPKAHFTGLDVSRQLIALAREQSGGGKYDVDDLSNLRTRFGIHGVTCLQVLHIMPNYQTPLHQIATRIRPKWIAFSTLVYEGDIDCQIVVTEHSRPRQSYHNIYGLPRLTMFMAAEKYTLKRYQPFNLDINIKRPLDSDTMRSWTDHGLVRSGPLLLPWVFMLFERGE